MKSNFERRDIRSSLIAVSVLVFAARALAQDAAPATPPEAAAARATEAPPNSTPSAPPTASTPAVTAPSSPALRAPTARDTAKPLPAVVVSAQPLEETIPAQLGRYGVRVNRVSAEQIEKASYVDVAQSLQTTVPRPVREPQERPVRLRERLLQGSRTQDVLWLLDGVRLNNRLYGGTTPLDTFPASVVDHLEVIEGPQALFYGTQGVAGAINVVTKLFSNELGGLAGARCGHQRRPSLGRLRARRHRTPASRRLWLERSLHRLSAVSRARLPAERHGPPPQLRRADAGRQVRIPSPR